MKRNRSILNNDDVLNFFDLLYFFKSNEMKIIEMLFTILHMIIF